MDKDQELLDPFQDDLDISEVLDDSEDEIYDSEDDPEASEEDETEEYEENEEAEEDDSDLNDKKAKRIRAIHIAVVVLGVLIVCEYTFFGVFFHNNKKKYEKAQKAASVTEAEAEEDTEENVVTEAPLPTTNVNDDRTSTTAEATTENRTYEPSTNGGTYRGTDGSPY